MIAVCKSIVEEASFEWLHHNVLSTDTKVRTIIIHSLVNSQLVAFCQLGFLILLCCI